MRFSAQDSSSVKWCRRRVRFNAVLEKALKVPRRSRRLPWKFWETLVQHQVTFQKVPEKVWQVLAQSQFRFDRVPEKVPEKVPGGFGAEPSHVQQGPGEGSGEGLAGFGKIVKIERCGCGRYDRRLFCLSLHFSNFFPHGVS
jgi:hypothetical protein